MAEILESGGDFPRPSVAFASSFVGRTEMVEILESSGNFPPPFASSFVGESESSLRSRAANNFVGQEETDSSLGYFCLRPILIIF